MLFYARLIILTIVLVSIIISIFYSKFQIIIGIALGLVLIFVICQSVSKFTPKANIPNKRIAIIGSGPAGILTCKKLQERGYKNITMYGKFEDCQLETMNIDGVIVDMQACFLHAGYRNSIDKLCDEENFETVPISTYIVDKNKKTKIKSSLLNISKVLFFMVKYFYWDKDPEVLSMNAKDFAIKHNFVWQAELVFLNGQLYGYPKDITTHSAFSWYSSLNINLLGLLVNGWYKMSEKNITGTMIVKQGYEPLFRSIMSHLTFTKIENLVSSVSKTDKGVSLVIDNGDIHHYDSVVIACAPTLLKSPIDHILSPIDYTKTRIFFIGYTSKVFNNVGVYYKQNVLENNEYNKITAYRCYGQNSKGLSIYGALGYVTKDIDPTVLHSRILDQLTFAPMELQIFWKVVDYNHRWSSSAIKNGKNTLAEDSQGKDNVWYATAPFCHWNLDGIYEHVTNISKRV